MSALEAVRAAFRSGSPPRFEEPAARLLSRLTCGEDQQLLALTVRSTAGNPLLAHAVNVAVLSLHIARGLGVGQDKLLLLGEAALLHDLRRLPANAVGGEELDKQLHPSDSSRLFEHVRELERVLSTELAQLYPVPAELSEAEWSDKRRPQHQGAHLLALCDLYESLSHPRPWREGQLPHDALLGLLKQHRRQSDQRLMRTFAEKLSVYPPGSYVLLSSDEIARVREVRSEAPTRPIVELCARADGASIRPELVDLARNQHLNIVRAVDETRIPLQDLRLRLRLRAARWWV